MEQCRPLLHPWAAAIRPDLLRIPGATPQHTHTPPSSPVLNTFTNHIPADTPPPAISPHPRPISPHFQASSSPDPPVGFTAGPPPAHHRSNSHSASFELFTPLPGRLAPSSQIPTETGGPGCPPGLSAGVAMPSSRPPPPTKCITTAAFTSMSSWYGRGVCVWMCGRSGGGG